MIAMITQPVNDGQIDLNCTGDIVNHTKTQSQDPCYSTSLRLCAEEMNDVAIAQPRLGLDGRAESCVLVPLWLNPVGADEFRKW